MLGCSGCVQELSPDLDEPKQDEVDELAEENPATDPGPEVRDGTSSVGASSAANPRAHL